MQLIRGVHNLKRFQPDFEAGDLRLSEQNSAALGRLSGSVVTVGAFDGLHRGHQFVLQHLVATAKARNARSIVITLDPLPREYFAPLSAPPRLMSFREKFEGLRQLGIDYMFLVKFNDTLRNVEAFDFIEHLFVEALSMHHIVIGDDFRFGRHGKGDYALLCDAGKKLGFSVESAPTYTVDDERVSSSRIRALLEAAKFSQAEKLLGRGYTISGKVVYGQRLARTIGTPTANIELRRLRAALSGVYAVDARLDGSDEWLPAVANVGTRPTVNDSIKAVLEVHIFDFDQTIYGRRITVRFRHKIRDEQKFDSIDELRTNILRDVETAQAWFSSQTSSD